LPAIVVAVLWSAAAASAACVGKTMNIVAHQDDDVIFLGTDEIADIQAGRCVQTIFVTAGQQPDSGIAWCYSREKGADAAHASMAGVARGTTDSLVLVDGKKISIHTLIGNQNVSMIYLRLPAEPAPNDQGLGTLRRGEGPVSTIPDANFDGSSARTYTYETLVPTLLVLMNRFNPDKLRIQDHDTGAEDHNDHVFTAPFALKAATSFAAARNIEVADLVTANVGYRTFRLPQNETGAPRIAKFQAFRVYGAFDHNAVCGNRDCSSFHTYGSGPGTAWDWFGGSRWMSRQYTLYSEPAGPLSDHFEIRGLQEKCIDGEGSATADGTPVQIWDCQNLDWQEWKYNSANQTISGLQSGKCLAVLNADPVSGTGVGISTCTAASTQTWTFTRDDELIGLGNLCLDLPSKQAVNGTNLTVKGC
jgi:LmbE family N-acetylglucosaminyl deacetylase